VQRLCGVRLLSNAIMLNRVRNHMTDASPCHLAQLCAHGLRAQQNSFISRVPQLSQRFESVRVLRRPVGNEVSQIVRPRLNTDARRVRKMGAVVGGKREHRRRV
jgi:hypothetical protein